MFYCLSFVMRWEIFILVLFLVGCSTNIEKNIGEKSNITQEVGKMELSSLDFNNNGLIPVKYTCQGKDINPSLQIKNLPNNTKSLVLIVDDPDAPSGNWDHWIVFNIDPTFKIEEDSVPGIEGINSWGENNYGGPCPPSGTHRYFFKLYALDTVLNLEQNTNKDQLLLEMEGHILEKAELIGLYKKS